MRFSSILAPSGGRRPPEGLNGGQRTRRATGAALVGPSAISSLYPAAIPSPFRRLCALRAAPPSTRAGSPSSPSAPPKNDGRNVFASQTSLWSSMAPPLGPRLGPRMSCDPRPSKTRDLPTLSALKSVGTSRPVPSRSVVAGGASPHHTDRRRAASERRGGVRCFPRAPFTGRGRGRVDGGCQGGPSSPRSRSSALCFPRAPFTGRGRGRSPGGCQGGPSSPRS